MSNVFAVRLAIFYVETGSIMRSGKADFNLFSIKGNLKIRNSGSSQVFTLSVESILCRFIVTKTKQNKVKRK